LGLKISDCRFDCRLSCVEPRTPEPRTEPQNHRTPEPQNCFMSRIALIDYRAGNLTSVKKAFAALGADLAVPERAQALREYDAVVVPGVGHFAATQALGAEWIDSIREGLEGGKPLLGICLGMQWLFEGSAEAPELPGLGVLEGRCYKLTADDN